MNEPGELEKIINDAENEPVLRLEVLAQLAETMGRPAARSGVLQGFMTPHLSMRPENRKATTDNRRDTGTGQQSA